MRRGELVERRAKRITHPGFGLIQPLGQGDYDGLCGLYAILNAIRLAAAPTQILSYKLTQRLFVSGVRYLAEKDALERAVCWAIERDRWSRLVKHLRREAWRMSRLRVHYVRVFEEDEAVDAQAVLATIEQRIAERKAILAFLRGVYRHYTVVAGATRTSLILFDSYGYRWLRKTSCVGDEAEAAKHNIHASSLIAVSIV